ncbi:hypothetical protein [Tsukamurella tyrosinosolvens]|uniref:hypothetical protein n=1 Tax=Tsukamurella tyrosinosolvens TaxID=57704 RepID=UPI00125F1B98|nr:hypothetical protein [Tsukamurella tyrosinosolvens]
MSPTPQLPYPFSEEGARIFLGEEAAKRLARFQPTQTDRGVDHPVVNDEPVYELEARRVALLDGGWVRAAVVFDDKSGGGRQPFFVADVVLAPGEVVAIVHGWFAHSAPGYGRDHDDRKRKWDESWGVVSEQR